MGMDIIELRDGTSVKYNRLTQSEYLVMLKEAIGSAVSKPFNIEAHCISGGNVLAKSNGDYSLFFSMNDLDGVISDFENGSSKGNEALMNKNKYGDKFPDGTGVLIQELLRLLDIYNEVPGVALLREIDFRIDNLEEKEMFMKQYFINIVAVVGEVLIKNNRTATWQMKLGTDGVTWNPFVKVKNKEYGFFIYLYEDVFLSRVKKKNILTEIYETMSGIIN